MRIDKDDFEQAVMKYSDVMYRCAYACCGNRSDAEDIVQDTFMQYLKRAPQFADENHRKAWLLRVVINLSKNLKLSFWVRNKRELTESIADAGDAFADCEIWSAVQQLPPNCRIIIELYYHEGLTIEEIAAVTRVKRSTVAYRLNKAKKLLGDIYKEGTL